MVVSESDVHKKMCVRHFLSVNVLCLVSARNDRLMGECLRAASGGEPTRCNLLCTL